MSIFIIAEAGVNHNGDVKIAKQLIDAAVSAGADAVKFQSFSAGQLVTAQAAKAEYQIKNTSDNGSQLAMLKKLELSAGDMEELAFYAQKKNILFLSTAFDIEHVDFLDGLGMPVFKIPSGEITHQALLEHIAAKRKPIILSTGMANMGEIEKAVNWIYKIWSQNPPAGWKGGAALTLLHCTSCYPTAPADCNLRAIQTMKQTFNLPVGYSDHTVGIEVTLAAAALGASVIEKHFTMDKNMPGPDHQSSLEPDELANLISGIRNIEKALGDGRKQATTAERGIQQSIRRSIVTARAIKAGEIFESKAFCYKRPGTGIAPEHKDMVVGLAAKRDIPTDYVLTWDDVAHA